MYNITEEQESLLVDKRYYGNYEKYLLDLKLHSDYFMIDELRKRIKLREYVVTPSKGYEFSETISVKSPKEAVEIYVKKHNIK